MEPKELYDLLHQVYKQEIKPEKAYYKILKAQGENSNVSDNVDEKKDCDTCLWGKHRDYLGRCTDCENYDNWTQSDSS
jgi:hypothetical protein